MWMTWSEELKASTLSGPPRIPELAVRVVGQDDEAVVLGEPDQFGPGLGRECALRGVMEVRHRVQR